MTYLSLPTDQVQIHVMAADWSQSTVQCAANNYNKQYSHSLFLMSEWRPKQKHHYNLNIVENLKESFFSRNIFQFSETFSKSYDKVRIFF